MAISQVLVYNMALGLLGEHQLTATTDTTKAADICNRFWEIAYKGALMTGTWGFATKVADLTVTSETPDDWAYEYQLPTDLIRIIDIPNRAYLKTSTDYGWNDGSVQVSAEYETRLRSTTLYFYCNVQDASLRYIYDHTTYASWPTWFAEYVAAKLAAIISSSITNSPGKRQEMLRHEMDMLRMAMQREATTSYRTMPTFNRYTIGRN